ncbi:MAG: hypothetical protein JO170_23385 [Verrucomicrobia bacterium]|nr:hypothetical protein [Verrucomicrobiota bacterium]
MRELWASGQDWRGKVTSRSYVAEKAEQAVTSSGQCIWNPACESAPAKDLFKGRHFDQGMIVLCARWYLTFQLKLP